MPTLWKEGGIQGIIAKNGAQIDLFWENGILKTAAILNVTGNSMYINYAKVNKIQLEYNGKITTLKASKGRFELPKTKAGQVFQLKF
ncbi:MAG: hypothetical protein V4497_10875 [Bacteroidota bacterium]